MISFRIDFFFLIKNVRNINKVVKITSLESRYNLLSYTLREQGHIKYKNAYFCSVKKLKTQNVSREERNFRLIFIEILAWFTNISQRHYRSFWHAIAEHVTEDEERIDEDIAGDRNVNSGGVVQLEPRPVENLLERVHRIDRQTDRKSGQYLHWVKSVT